MALLWQYLARPGLFCLSPEKAHRLALKSLHYALKIPGGKALLRASRPVPLTWTQQNALGQNPLRTPFCGITLPNPIGLAAGCDKDGSAIEALFALGFGMVEVGTFTPKPQQGNPSPRVFRLTGEGGLVNRMGLPNVGMEAGYKRLALLRNQTKPLSGVLGVNIGCNNTASTTQMPLDFALCAQRFLPVADYLSVNISCPNVYRTDTMQQVDIIRRVVDSVAAARAKQPASPKKSKVPLLLKLSPDTMAEKPDAVAASIDAAVAAGFDGLIGFNTTGLRAGLCTHPNARQLGGLSGAPLQSLALKQFTALSQMNQGRLVLVGCGGIDGAASAKAFMAAGATAVQLYTALIYQGPTLVFQLLHDLSMAFKSTSPKRRAIAQEDIST